MNKKIINTRLSMHTFLSSGDSLLSFFPLKQILHNHQNQKLIKNVGEGSKHFLMKLHIPEDD